MAGAAACGGAAAGWVGAGGGAVAGAGEGGPGAAEPEPGGGDAELGGGVLGAANVGVLLAVAVVPLDEEQAASPMASAISPVRAASFPIVLLGAPFADAIRCAGYVLKCRAH